MPPARAGALHATGRQPRGSGLLWHINCLELWTVHLALWQFRPLLLGNHVLVHMDITAAVSVSQNRLGGIRSHRMSQLARHLLHCALSTSRGSSIVRPTRSHDSSYPPVSSRAAPPQAESTPRPARRTSHRRRAGRRILRFFFVSVPHFLKEKAISITSGLSGL